MRREVERRRRVPAFKIDIDEFGILWERCIGLFDNQADLSTSLNIELPSEALSFDTFAEFKIYDRLPAVVTKYTLYLRGRNGQSMAFRGGRFATAPEVNASGGNEAWPAGAVETVLAFANTHRVWHWWITAAPLFWIISIIGWGGMLLAQTLVAVHWMPAKIAWGAVVAWLFSLLSLLALADRKSVV